MNKPGIPYVFSSRYPAVALGRCSSSGRRSGPTKNRRRLLLRRLRRRTVVLAPGRAEPLRKARADHGFAWSNHRGTLPYDQ